MNHEEIQHRRALLSTPPTRLSQEDQFERRELESLADLNHHRIQDTKRVTLKATYECLAEHAAAWEMQRNVTLSRRHASYILAIYGITAVDWPKSRALHRTKEKQRRR